MLRDKIRGALYGVAVGDALGAPLEFMKADEIQRKHGTVSTMLGGGWLDLKPGETTDDTAMTLAVAQGIVESPEDPIEAIGAHFVEWFNSNPPDVGNTCALAIQTAMHKATNPARPSILNWFGAAKQTDTILGGKSAGNGSLMRTVYPGLYYRDIVKAWVLALQISNMTHYDVLAGRACVAYTELVHIYVNSNDNDITRPLETVRLGDYDLNAIASDNFKPVPSGFVVDSFSAALHCILTTRSFPDALIKAVNLGGDADTIGAITGGLAGAIYGYSEIPASWAEALPEHTRSELDYFANVAYKHHKLEGKQND